MQRKAGLRFFNSSNLRSFIDDVLPPLLQEMLRILRYASNEEQVLDLQTAFLDLTTRLMGKVAYDVSLFHEPESHCSFCLDGH